MASTKLVRALHQTPLHSPPCCATVAQRPSNPIVERDRDQRDHLCPPTRAGEAALRGRTIIWHHQRPDRRRVAHPLFWTLPRSCNPSLREVCERAPPRDLQDSIRATSGRRGLHAWQHRATQHWGGHARAGLVPYTLQVSRHCGLCGVCPPLPTHSPSTSPDLPSSAHCRTRRRGTHCTPGLLERAWGPTLGAAAGGATTQ